MRLRHSSALGLAVHDRTILCAQVARAGARPVVQKLARFTLPADVGFEDPQRVGAALKQFLESHGFTAKHAVVGLPAKVLIAQDRELPPADLEQAAGILRLHAERMSPSESVPVVADYTGVPKRDAASRVLLVAVLKDRLDRVAQCCKSAGLVLSGVTSTALTAESLTRGSAGNMLALVSEGSMELVVRDTTGVRTLRHVASTARSALGGDLKRAIALLPGGDETRRLALSDGVGLGDDLRSEITRTAGVSTADPLTLSSIDASVPQAALNGDAGALPRDAFLPPVALAIAGLDRRQLPVNFLVPRLAPPAQRRFGRRAVWAAVIAGFAVLAMGLLYTTVLQRENEATALAGQLREVALDLRKAESTIDRIAYGRTYFETRLPFLECLREVTLAFNYDEPVWATSFTLRDNRKGQLQGKASDQRTVLSVLDRLKNNPKFSTVQLQDLREAGTRSREVTFSIAFTFVSPD